MIPDRIFVTGTDTGVGKTFVCAVLMGATKEAYYWKPIQTGSVEGTDRDWIRRITDLPEHYFLPESYCFKNPVSPHLAALLENKRIELSDIELPVSPSGKLIVEGAGGVMVPINEREFMLDLILHLQLPAIIVARSTLGTINHTLLTIGALRNAGVEIAGVILNGPQNSHNREAIEYYGQVKVLAEIEPLSNITRESLRNLWRRLSLSWTAYA